MAPVVEVSDAGHCRALLLELNEQRLRGQFCDVTIIAEDTKFRAHKNVLAASSPFFKRALAQEPSCPSPAQVLELPGVQAGVFSDVLNFIYNSRLAVPSPAAARALGAVGRRLGIPSLQGLEAGPPPRDANGSWTPPAPAGPAGDPRAPAAPVDLTCPARPGEAAGGETAPAGGDTGTAPPSPASPASPPSASLRCGLCGRGFSSAAALGFHAKLHRGRRGLCCRHCGKSFIHVKRLQTHEVGCRDGDGDDNNAAAAAAAAGTGAAAAPKAAKKALLLRHRALEPGAEQEPLVKVVDGQVLYLCGVCQRSYMTLSSLKRHANVHSWRRKYPCRYCDKVFALAEYRTKHEVWHTGERRYQCIFCWDTFVTYYNLKTHQKAFHGISPGLIASEKTPNGGYRPKLNALKLYRLLPMRAHKRPYKTYSQGAVPDGALPPPAAPGDAAGAAYPPAPRPEPASVIAYGRAAPSVIVRGGGGGGGGSGAASVIAYNGRAGEEAPGLPEAPAAAPVTPAVPIKKQVLRDYIEAQRAAAAAATEGSAAPQNPAGGGSGGSGGGSGRTMTYVAKPAYAGSAAGEGLCQITVRIGEEAIVKRRISGTDLRGDGAEARRGDDDSDAEDRLWRPYYSYKPKRKAGGAAATPGAAPGATPAAKKPRWRRKLRSLRWAPGDDGEGDSTPRRRERHHACRVCGKSFPALRKLRKHQRGHEGTAAAGTTAGTGRVGRRPSLRFACPTCAKVCKTAAALSRHAQRHRPGSPPGSPRGSRPGSPRGSARGSPPGSRPGSPPRSPPGSPARSPAPPTVIAYTPPAAGREETPADKGGVPPPPGVTGPEPPPAGDTGGGAGGGAGGFPVQEQPLALLCRAGGGDPELGDGAGGTPRGGPRVPPAPPAFPVPFGPRLVAAYPFPFPLPLALVLPDPERGFLAGGGAGGPSSCKGRFLARR
ncbi:PREDICTED: zinc finger and BTB domain-containing protein 4 [Pseudopodoces humilis]|uniref:zinc finger and BTB domain-containing protein 4 n=1 Tax=Pseudopodoces humilis TaxID=181119 RepID=UPI0006B85FD7|nr:PREDICTED: zinc finger and BTB domain-containing protein 4 [Pseudopodoces humilis]